ncbi:MAG: xanthine dehydrogenase family protein molybdopterin-binding subunit [Limnohabitans sp.]|nr:xanthine dehydrogenase family protein molybdopterin-binding subunit [Limnohabitans sp.]
MSTETNRRDFLKTTSVATSGLMMGVVLPSTVSKSIAAGTLHTPNAWVHIADDNTITLISARSEMGQGVYTSMPMLIAEELNVDVNKVVISAAPSGAVYVNALLGAMITGGSTSVRDGWEKLRIAGAQVREMLVGAAAAEWGVPASAVKADNGMLTGPGGKKATYGQMAEAASKQPVPEKPFIKAAKDFRVVGKRIARTDAPAKVNGTAEFGIDVRLPGMVYASLEQSPVQGGKVIRVDSSAAKAMAGVVDVVEIPDGVAVVANSYWRAVKARRALKIDWDLGPAANLSSDGMIESHEQASSTGKVLPIQPPKGDAMGAIGGSAKKLSATYITPLQSHSPMEPMNFTAHVTGGKALLIGPTQFQQGVQGGVAAALGIKPEDVEVQTTFLGGGFGRRIELDYPVQAALISKAVKLPVKLVWSREDDMTNDYYRPIGYNQIHAGLDSNGMPVGLHFKLTSQSITQRAFGLPKDTMDPFMVEAAVAPYKIANTQHDLVIHDAGLRVGYWRGVSHNMNVFANESFVDEMALAAGKDPVDYRMAMLEGEPRFQNVLKLATEKAGYKKGAAKGNAMGVSIMSGYDTYVAVVAEVSIGADGEVKVVKTTVAADMGMIVNPEIVEQQIQSSIIMGMGTTLKHSITVANGRVQQTNFNTYPMVRTNESPLIDIVLVKSAEKPGGIGEPVTAAIVPALANAVAKLTGKRVRTLPITGKAIQQA